MFEIISNYSLSGSDYLEAKQLYKRSLDPFWSDFFWGILFLLLALLELKEINNADFLVLATAKKLFISQTEEYHVLMFFMYNLCSIIFFSQIFPRYNLICRRNISRSYRNNFIKQEDKTITINETGIKIVSANYREIRQWQDYNKFAENKQLFLLFGNGQTNIIPKRIFNGEEQLNSFLELLEDKIKS